MFPRCVIAFQRKNKDNPWKIIDVSKKSNDVS
jgi:hypothetical protein